MKRLAIRTRSGNGARAYTVSHGSMQPHGAERADEGERGPRHHHGAEAGELADGGDVAGRARHEVADAVGVVEGRRHAQQMREEIVADVALHPLPRAEHGEARAHARRAVRRGEEQDDQDVARQRRSALLAERIDRVLDRPRDAERDARAGGQAQDPDRVATPVPVEICPEPAGGRHSPSIGYPRRGGRRGRAVPVRRERRVHVAKSVGVGTPWRSPSRTACPCSASISIRLPWIRSW